MVRTLRSTAGLRGRVVDEVTKQPVADAFVFIKDERTFNEERNVVVRCLADAHKSPG